jgi:hypothetical protein
MSDFRRGDEVRVIRDDLHYDTWRGWEGTVRKDQIGDQVAVMFGFGVRIFYAHELEAVSGS